MPDGLPAVGAGGGHQRVDRVLVGASLSGNFSHDLDVVGACGDLSRYELGGLTGGAHDGVLGHTEDVSAQAVRADGRGSRTADVGPTGHLPQACEEHGAHVAMPKAVVTP